MNSPEPIAIVGMACRFAGGVGSPAEFWDLLRTGGDAVGELPAGRWDGYAARDQEHADAVRDVTRRGAFLDDVEGFDADFFDITPREAELLDPQQRIMLELAWEALEHAGIPPADLAGSDAGVFVGVGSDDYGRRLLEDLPRIEAWTGIGGSYCGVANRVSYTLDLRGPSMAVDTACSSSLVSIHLAAQALRAGECPVALAGGVLVMAAPGLSMVLDAAGALAPDGRSKSFDAAADGYGRGEGGGFVVLKRLADARRDGDRVLAVLRGSAVHQDGRTNGIMAPSGEAQIHLMRRACRAAGIDPAEVGYVEAHGTGTRVGDPIEAAALGTVFAEDRPADRPLLIGSVKPNVGHLEAGAGVAGVIKTVLALQHGEIPPSPHIGTPNPAIAWDELRLRAVTGPVAWPDTGGPRLAGVSGYGYGGTIAHLLLEAGDPPVPADAADAGGTGETGAADARLAVYPLSAADPAALARHAGRLADRLSRPGAPGTADTGFTLARRRPRLPHRAAVVAGNRAELVERLRELAAGGQDAGTAAVPTGSVLPGAERGPVWVFSGQGSQWTGMGRELLAEEPVFAEVIERLEPVFRAELDVSPRAVLLDDAPRPTSVVQPMIFAMQVALAAVWRAHGVRPGAVIGHSVGEIAAAVTTGVLSLEEGAALVCRRSVLLRRLEGRGAMAMVALPPEEAERRLAGRRDVAVAVAASPGSAVLSGGAAAMRELTERWSAQGVRIRPVDSDVAFHSPQADPLCAPLAAAAAGLRPRPPRLPLYTTALDDPRDDAPRDGAYWAANLRAPVRFAAAVAAAAEDGYTVFLEVSPHPVVEHSIVETLDAHGVTDHLVAHTLRRARPERAALLANLGQLSCHGAEVDWSACWPGGAPADLPATPWRHRPYWAAAPEGGTPVTGRHDPAGHTLLGGRTRMNGTTPAHAWLTRVDRASRPYPGEHPVREVEIVPAAVLLTTFLTAAAATAGWSDLADVALRVPVSLTRPRDVQVVLQDGTLRLSSRMADGDPDDKGWITHTTAAVEPHAAPAPGGGPVAAGTPLPPSHVVDRLGALGVAGMGFPWTVERIRTDEGVLALTVRAGDAAGPGDPAKATWAPILDAAMSAGSVALPDPPTLRMPARLHRLSLPQSPPVRADLVIRVTGENTVDIEILAPEGGTLGTLTGLRYGELDGEAGAVANPRRLVHEITWRAPEGAADRTAAPSGVVLVGPRSALRDALAEGLARTGTPHRVASSPSGLRDAAGEPPGEVLVVPRPGRPGRVEQDAGAATRLLARTVRTLAAGTGRASRLWCVTQGVRECAGPAPLGHAPLWGLARIIGAEHPDLWGGVIDVDGVPDVPAVLDVLRGTGGEDVVAVRDGGLLVPRLRFPEGDPVRAPISCRPDGTYLITGGLGVLGLEVAQWLAARGARRLVLAGRRTLPPRDSWDELTDPADVARVRAIRSLERLGVTVVVVTVDVADAETAGKLLSPAALGLPPIRGVVHAAGVVDNRLLRDLDGESLRAVQRPKIGGALVLHSLFPPGEPDFFVLFSSCGQLLGLPGQGAYAASNAFLDGLAAHRRNAGDTGTISFGWTSWRGLGMSRSSAVIDEELAARGTADISRAEAFQAWELAERYDLGYAAVLRTIPLDPGRRRPPLFDDLPAEPAADAGAAAAAAPWAGLHGPELRDFLHAEITRRVAAETGLGASDVDPGRPLVEMGVDSVMTVRIRRGLERGLHRPLPATLFWDRPTVEAVAEFLADGLDAAGSAVEEASA